MFISNQEIVSYPQAKSPRRLSSPKLSLEHNIYSGKMKWKAPNSAFNGVLLSGVFPSSASCTKLYSPLIRATTWVLSSIGRTLNGAVLVYSKLSPGFKTG